MARRVFITVGEASGDQHAAHLIRELRALDPQIIVEGLGGDAMRFAGAIVHHDTVERAAMGWEMVFRYIELRRMRSWTERYFAVNPPDLQICIDSWTMNWHWARLARQRGIPVLYYIAPQMWASRPGRIKRLAKYVNKVACILPFEEQFFHDHGVDATFVGHPLFDAVQPVSHEAAADRFPQGPPVIGIVPGSRTNVAEKNFPHLLDVTDHILQTFPGATFLIPTMPATHDVVKSFLAKRGMAPVISSDGGRVETIGPFVLGLSQGDKNYFDQFMDRCDLCLAVSGTATLQAAAHDVPMVVVYRLNRILWHSLLRWLINTRTYSLVNLLSENGRNIVPEYIPWYGSNKQVIDKTMELLSNPAMLNDQREAMRKVVRGLARPGASRNVAKVAMELLEKKSVS